MNLGRLKNKWQERGRNNATILEATNLEEGIRNRAVNDLNIINEFLQDLEKLK